MKLMRLIEQTHTFPTRWINFSNSKEITMITAQTNETAHVGVWSSSREPLIPSPPPAAIPPS